MEYISSDTNVWIDFFEIDKLDIPFRLPYTYIINEEVLKDELINPKGIGIELKRLGLVSVELTEDEFYLAAELNIKYSKPSTYDCVALAIAKVRGITLLTGDKALRKAAEKEGVKVIGTIGIIDILYSEQRINKDEYREIIETLLDKNGYRIRLPEDELKSRLLSI